jgi:hypothetical protein
MLSAMNRVITSGYLALLSVPSHVVSLSATSFSVEFIAHLRSNSLQRAQCALNSDLTFLGIGD